MLRTIALSLCLALATAPALAAELYDCSFRVTPGKGTYRVTILYDRQSGSVTVTDPWLPKGSKPYKPRLEADTAARRAFRWSFPLEVNREKIATSMQMLVVIDPRTMAAQATVRPSGSFALPENIRRWPGNCTMTASGPDQAKPRK